MQTCDEQMLKISRQYLDLPKSYDHLTENLAQQMAYFQQNWLWPTESRPFVALNFQLNGHNFYVNQDIALKFSAFVHHMSALNWQKNFGYYSISVPVAPSSMPKLLTPLATIFVEIFFQKKIWWGFGPIWVTPRKDFLISWKKWRFEIFQTTVLSRASGSC